MKPHHGESGLQPEEDLPPLPDGVAAHDENALFFLIHMRSGTPSLFAALWLTAHFSSVAPGRPYGYTTIL
jgi:hypothetical protein